MEQTIDVFLSQKNKNVFECFSFSFLHILVRLVIAGTSGNITATDDFVVDFGVSTVTSGLGTETVNVLLNSTTEVVIIAYNTIGFGGILASFSNGDVTDASWQCIHGSMTSEVTWPAAVLHGLNDGGFYLIIDGIATYASWIWTSSLTDDNVACRKTFYSSFSIDILPVTATPSSNSDRTSINIAPSTVCLTDTSSFTASSAVIVQPTATSIQASSSSEVIGPSEKDDLKKLQGIDITKPEALEDLTDTTTRIFELSEENININDEERLSTSLFAADVFEKRIMDYAQFHLNNETNTSIIRKKNDDFSILMAKMSRIIRTDNEELIFPAQEEVPLFMQDSNSEKPRNYIAIPIAVIPNDSIFVAILNLRFKNNVSYSHKSEFGDERLNTGLLSAAFLPKPETILKRNITFVLSHTNDTLFGSRCVFVQPLINNQTRLSSDGCSIVNTTNSSTKCTCNHMTSFAVLTKIDSAGDHRRMNEDHRKALSIITYIGLSLSLLGETLAVVCFLTIIGLKTDQAHLHTNLALSLALAQIFFLIAMNITTSKATCVFVAGLIHYFYLVTFCWMLVEGYHLYLMVVKVFHEESYLKKYYIFSWISPLIIVLVCISSAALTVKGVKGYSSDKFCWISAENGYIWAFLVPVILVCLVNFILLALVVREMGRMNHPKHGPSLNTRKSVKACLLLFPILGTTWLLCLITIVRPSLVLEYFFNIFNSLQGFLIFFLHVVRSTELWSGFERRKVRWLNSLELSNHVSLGNKTAAKTATSRALNTNQQQQQQQVSSHAASTSSIKPIIGNWMVYEENNQVDNRIDSPHGSTQHEYTNTSIVL